MIMIIRVSSYVGSNEHSTGPGSILQGVGRPSLQSVVPLFAGKQNLSCNKP